jgi:hypothetical protein
MGPIRRILGLPEEIQFFGRLGAYGIGIGIVYWVLTGEVAGTLLLVGFGLATGVLGALLWRGRPSGEPGPDDGEPSGGPFHDESGRVPGATYAPLEFGFGVALLALALVFGAPMAVASIVPLVAGGIGWLRAASAEWGALERSTTGGSSGEPASGQSPGPG